MHFRQIFADIKSFVEGAVRKEQLIYTFVERFETTTLEKITFINTSEKKSEHYIFVEFLLIEGKV